MAHGPVMVAKVSGIVIGLMAVGIVVSLSARGGQSLPGGITLLPGYSHIEQRGIDSIVGRIVKQGGPSISYEIGGQRADITQSVASRNVLWTKTQVVHGETVRAIMTNDARLLLDVGFAHFIANNVRNEEDIADVLLMSLTFDADVLQRQFGLKPPKR